MADQRGGEQSFLKLIASANRYKCGIKTIGLPKTIPHYIYSLAPCKDNNYATKVPGQLEGPKTHLTPANTTFFVNVPTPPSVHHHVYVCQHFHNHFPKDQPLNLPRHSILATMQSQITRVALDDRYANKFAPLDSMAIYPKPGHKLLYTPMTGEMKCPRLYLCLAHSIPSPSMSMQHMHQHDQQ